jgi:hypothetical protein
LDPAKRWANPYVLDGLQHKVQTIQLVNQQLSNPMTASSDALIAAVSILIAIEVRVDSRLSQRFGRATLLQWVVKMITPSTPRSVPGNQPGMFLPYFLGNRYPPLDLCRSRVMTSIPVTFYLIHQLI